VNIIIKEASPEKNTKTCSLCLYHTITRTYRQILPVYQSHHAAQNGFKEDLMHYTYGYGLYQFYLNEFVAECGISWIIPHFLILICFHISGDFCDFMRVRKFKGILSVLITLCMDIYGYGF